MATGKILIVDDDTNICELLRLYIAKEGFEASIANDGETALKMFDSVTPDLILLDIMLPGLDGWQVCYVVKPFETKEVVARINAVLRRSGKNNGRQDDSKEVSYENLTINLTNYELKVNGKQVDTPPKEMELIYHLASNPNRVFTRDQLLDEVWGFDYYGDSRTVDVHVKRLREKLEGVSDKWTLKTVWGVGYKFEVKGT